MESLCSEGCGDFRLNDLLEIFLLNGVPKFDSKSGLSHNRKFSVERLPNKCPTPTGLIILGEFQGDA